MLLPKKQKIKILDAIQELIEILHSINNKTIKTQIGVEAFLEIGNRLENLEKDINELKK